MEIKKRVYCLYRVSRLAQVDKDDIPVQKQACHEFAGRQGWEITKEFYEKGVSGFKVSSKDRDAIIEIQREAALGNFDILLVFMFDRLGRRDDETPFVVEWFIQNNIAVWSVSEGEQRIDTHTDKLLNYIRYWQASGESIKTSIRVKAGVARIAEDGHYAGGPVMFGYRLEKSERINTKGYEALDYVVDDESVVEIVKLIYHKYANEGYGARRLADYLIANGIRRHDGKPFSQANLSKILTKELYNGYVVHGEARTYVPALKIIDDDLFKRAQEIRIMRYKLRASERRLPMSTKADSLLSGNIFCGNCGYRLTFSPQYVSYRKKNGEMAKYQHSGYVCGRGHSNDGTRCHVKYTSHRIDGAIKGILQQIFEQIREAPPADCWGKHHECRITELQNRIKTTTREISKLNKELSTYKGEVIKVIQGNSSFTAEILNKLILDAEGKVSKQSAELDGLKSELGKSDYLYEEEKEKHTRIRTWAEIFDESSKETQKMVAASLIREVRVNKGYKIEIDFNISVREFVESVSYDNESINISVVR